MFNEFNTAFLGSTKEFIENLPSSDQAKISASEDTMKNGDFASVYIKVLRGHLRELIVMRYRLIFCIEGRVIYFLRAFMKKSSKTPKHEIDSAEKTHKLLIAYLQNNKQ